MTPATDLKFLIVDDFPPMRRTVRALLLEIGCHRADEAEDGAAALRMLRGSKYDFVVTDINMPNLNGFDLLREVKDDESLRHIPILMVTAEARSEEILMAAQCGAAGYVVKPLTRTTLEDKVQEVLHRLATPA